VKLTKVLDVMIAVLVIWIAYSFIERAVSSAERSPIVETEKRTPGLLQVGSLIDSALFGAQRRQDNTLIVYLSTSCPFCNASRDTYRSLSSLRPNLRLIVITSEPSADVKDWLKEADISVDEVRELPISNVRALGLNATPTLILTDGTGAVEGVWYGQLNAEEGLDLLTNVRRGFVSGKIPSHASLLKVVSVEHLQDPMAVVIDMRPRFAFKKNARIAGKILNIPQDELEIRARNELSKDSKIIVDCSSMRDHLSCSSAGLALARQGFSHVSLMQWGVDQKSKTER
jgi:rhodanese-related sulfurtransferase